MASHVVMRQPQASCGTLPGVSACHLATTQPTGPQRHHIIYVLSTTCLLACGCLAGCDFWLGAGQLLDQLAWLQWMLPCSLAKGNKHAAIAELHNVSHMPILVPSITAGHWQVTGSLLQEGWCAAVVQPVLGACCVWATGHVLAVVALGLVLGFAGGSSNRGP
jgi:hypothetical protein